GPGERVSDLWGWTDPATRREYALVGRTGALVFVDLTDASSPRVVGEMPAPPSGARDIKVYKDHAFMTGDGAGQHGLMIFDLTRLRAATGTGNRFAPDTVYRGIAAPTTSSSTRPTVSRSPSRRPRAATPAVAGSTS